MEIIWLDSTRQSVTGWMTKDFAEKTADDCGMRYRAAGYVVKATKDYIALTFARDDECDLFCDFIQIPTCSILKSRILAQMPLEDESECKDDQARYA